jgi:hypothetical protein
LYSIITERNLRQSEHKLREPQQKIKDERLCLSQKAQTLLEKALDAAKKKNREEATQYAAECAEFRKRAKIFYNVELTIERLRICIDSFPCDYVHGSKPSKQVLSRLKGGVTSLRYISQEIAPFIPDVYEQISSECIKLKNFLADLA